MTDTDRELLHAMQLELLSLRAKVDSPPIVSWMAVADTLGVSDDTIQRWRRRTGDQTAPCFDGRDAVLRWWRKTRYGQRPRPRTSSSVSARGATGPTLAELEANLGRRKRG